MTVWSIHNSTYATAGKPRRAFWTHWIQFMAVPAIVGLVLTSFIIFLDTAVWWKETQHSLTIIPLNWLRGGLSTGITTDQRGFTLWKHPLVSLLWVVGPGLLFYGFRAAREIFRPAPPAVALSLDPEDVDWENENTSVPPNYSARHSRGKPVIRQNHLNTNRCALQLYWMLSLALWQCFLSCGTKSLAFSRRYWFPSSSSLPGLPRSGAWDAHFG